MILSAAGSSAAFAYDRLVNIDDAGFDPFPAGGTVELTVDVTNNGPDGAPATTLFIDVPADGTLTAVNGDFSCSGLPASGGTTVSCSLPALADGETSSVVLDLTAPNETVLVTRVRVPDAGDSDSGNDDLSETTTITQGSELGLDLVNPPTGAGSGDTITLDYQITNNGPNASTGSTLSFPIPTGLANIVPPAGCTLSGSTYSCPVGAIPLNGTQTLTFQGQIAAEGGSTVTPTASLVNVQPGDADTSNNTATTDIPITSGTDLSITKDRAPTGTLLIGDPVTFTIGSQYTGESPTNITITDQVPAEYTIDAINAPGWTVTQTGQTLTFERAGGSGAGANVSLGDITIEATANAAGTNVRNEASISADGPTDNNLGNNTADDGGATIEAATVDLVARKFGQDPALATVNGTYVFQIGTRNEGTADYFGEVELEDNFPAGLTLTSIPEQNGWTCTPSGALPLAGPASVSCVREYTSGDPLEPGDNTPLVDLEFEPTQDGTLTNSMTVDALTSNIAEEPGDLGNNTITQGVAVSTGPNSADIRTLKSAAVDPVLAGDVQTYTIEVVNDGPATSADVELSDDLRPLISNGVGPTDEGFIGVTVTRQGVASAPACSSSAAGTFGRLLTCDIASLPVCTAGTDCPVFEVQVRPGRNADTRTNTASSISDTTADPNLSNNSGSASYTIDARAELTVTKTVAATPVPAGQDVTFVITAQNLQGYSDAENVTITDTLPADVIFVSATPSAGSCTTTPTSNSVTGTGNDQVVCNFGTVEDGTQQTATIVVRPTNATRGTTLNNVVDVTTTTDELDLTNNSANVDVVIEDPDLDLLVNKTDTIDPLTIGEDTVYVLTVANNGASASENVIVNDQLPASLVSYQSHTVSGDGTCGTVPAVDSTGGTLECTWPYLAAGDSETVEITVRGIGKGSVRNNVSIDSDEIDPSSPGTDFDRLEANNATEENTTIRTRTDIEATSKTATPATVALNEDFTYELRVLVGSGASVAEADDVEISDTLPSGMVLTGTPSVSAAAGAFSGPGCGGSAGDDAFTCDLGTVDEGSDIRVTVPVEVLSRGGTTSLTNSFTVSTSSFDVDGTDNTTSGPVAVEASSIAGTIYRDFDDDVTQDGTDTGVGGVELTLTGTSSDGRAVTRTITTNPDGTYLFDELPEGSYQIVRDAVSEPNLDDRPALPGSEGGTGSGATTIASIPLPASTDATDYDFRLVPQAQVGIAKDLSAAPSVAADGSATFSFSILVENLSQEPLTGVAVTDALAGGDPLFGTLATPADPANDPLTAGEYAVVSAPSGSCGGLQSGFDGSGSQTLASGFDLAVGASCSIAITLRVQPDQVNPTYENQAIVTAEGALSGQTSATNPGLRDLSDDGADVDANNDGDAGDAGEDDPTPVAVTTPTGTIALVKAADISGLSDPPVAGETLGYTFFVTNTGTVTLTDVVVTDTSLPGVVVSGGPITSLAPGQTDSTTFTAAYVLQQSDVDAGTVTNSADVTAEDPVGRAVTDVSGTATTNDNPTETTLTPAPAIALLKSLDGAPLSGTPVPGDLVTYRFRVVNTGNVNLSDVQVTDPLFSPPEIGAVIASLAPGEERVLTRDYPLMQADIDRGRIDNQASVAATPPVNDLSGTTVSDDDITQVPVPQVAAIDLVKTVDESGVGSDPAAGDELRYSFAVTNTGNVTLTGVTVTERLVGAVLIGGPIPTLAPGATDDDTYTATYTVTAADVTAGSVVNDATAEGFYGPDADGSLSVSDDDAVTSNLAVIEALPETFPEITTDGGTTTTVLASDSVDGAPADLTNVTIRVIDADPGVTLDPATGLITLEPGRPAGVYEVEYEICSVANPGICDTTTETVVQGVLPAVMTVKTQEFVDNGDDRQGVGDTVIYTIAVTNTGNTALDDVALTDTLQDRLGRPQDLASGPTFVSADAGSPEGALEVGEVATYTAEVVLTDEMVAGRGLENSAEASGTSVIPDGVGGVVTDVRDVSDDDDDTDGDTEGDPTVLILSAETDPEGLSIAKSTPRDVVRRGETVPYTITVRNDGVADLGPLDLRDRLPDGFLYVDGSAQVDGVDAEVEVGRNATDVFWRDLTVPAGGELNVTLRARILNGTPVGDYVNRAQLFDPDTGARILGPATATVSILPEAVFDCGEVIGKVFEDRNGDGYQNAPGAGRGISDQSYATGKGGKLGVAPERAAGEPGIPAVRLATVDGLIITTDEYGRFSVPCAALPADRGSNFILKLDDRSLPSGYRVTTENPRIVRLTPGMMTEMNFGAAIGRVVRVDLGPAAFVAGGDGRSVPSAALEAGLRSLVAQIDRQPVNLRLAYHVGATAGPDEVRTARRQMRVVERRLKRLWREAGFGPLRIEPVIVRPGQ